MNAIAVQATCIECEHWFMGLCFKDERKIENKEPDAKSCDDFIGDKPIGR